MSNYVSRFKINHQDRQNFRSDIIDDADYKYYLVIGISEKKKSRDY